jgi:hypothetical protein
MMHEHEPCAQPSRGGLNVQAYLSPGSRQGFTEAWYQLSKDEQDALWAKAEEIDRRAGAVWKIACNSR